MLSTSRTSLRVFLTPNHLILQSAAAGTTSQLVIDCKNQHCRNQSNFNPFEFGIKSSEIHVYEAFGFLGLLHVEKFTFAVLVSKVRTVGDLGGHTFCQIAKTTFVPLGDYQLGEEAKRLLDSMVKLLESGFYYSRTYDLTQSLQKQHELSMGSFMHDHAESKFYWNRELYKELALQGADHKWFMPVIQGYVKIQTFEWGAEEFQYLLVSRRSCTRAGTRYNARGVDDEGEVANFVETEQIAIIDNTWFGLVMVRGTVPVFWQQTGVTARFEVTRTKELTAPAYLKSMNNLVNTYQKVLVINLLSNKKPHERVLSESFREQLRLHHSHFEETVSYLAYDYKAETKGDFSSADDLIRQASPMLLCHLYFSMQNKQILTLQKGVTRINCLDCLDRTNVIMSRVAWYMLGWMFRSLQKVFEMPFDNLQDNPTLATFKAIWAENGDALSLQYTGAGSTTAVETKTGRSGLMAFIDHSVKSIGRFYSANVDDHKKQDGIETLLGKHIHAALVKNMHLQTVQRQMALREAEYLENAEARLRVVSWNVRGQRPPSSDIIANVLFPAPNDSPPHIISIGLQDLVLVNPSNVFQSTKNLAIIEAWIQLISVAFTRYSRSKYLMLKTDLQVGLLTIVYVLEGCAGSITNVDLDKVKVGLGTALGGKGAVVVRFNLFQTSICLCNTHLLGTVSENATRLQQLDLIESMAFQTEAVGKRKGYKISSHDVIILFGDLNFKIASPDYETHRFCKEGNMNMLLANDQLLTILTTKKSSVLNTFKEGDIDFLPTVNRSELTKSIPDPQKPLSWADRILYSGKGTVLESYGPVDVSISDHLPICANFTLRIQKINEEKRARIEREEMTKVTQQDASTDSDSHRRTVSHNL